jgi:ribosome modulation factor
MKVYCICPLPATRGGAGGHGIVKKHLRNLTICIALGATPFYAVPLLCNAQQVDEDQRAYQVGYQNGVNDAQSGKPMNLHTGDWHGNRLNIYQNGYQKGYDSVKGYGARGARGPDQYQGEDRSAYEAGYQNGADDARNNRSMNISTNNWHGDRVNIYQQAYREGYDSVKGYGAGHGPEHVAYPQGYNPNLYQGDKQRAYQTGYQNGINDAQRNQAMNPATDSWHGDNLAAYQTGYDQGYHSASVPMR